MDTLDIINYIEINRNKGNFSFFMPRKEQLQALMSKKDIVQALRKDSTQSDVVSVNMYRKLRVKNVIQDNDLTLQYPFSFRQSVVCGLYKFQ